MVQHSQTWVDPHVHLFALDEGQYNWLKPTNAPFWADKKNIAKNTTETMLHCASLGQLCGFVHIEAGYDNSRPWREIAFLERHCTLPFRSVGCIDLAGNSVGSHIDKLGLYSSVSGLRHILDDEAETLLRAPKVKWALGHMATKGLSFDAQFNIADSSAVVALLNVLEQNPALKVAINHAALAPLDKNSLAFRTWRQNTRVLNETGQVAFKFSGLEMQERRWHWQRANYIFETLLDTVGTNQIMFASNFPLCQWRMAYAELWHGFSDMITPLSETQKAALLSINAKQWYDIA
ncbi:amidohydrolase family protein [Alteromonas macleodii]|uniref:Putative TIM-barrel fold metal-dependent hydrolase n=1 Tax=Alteromonas macleodii TaxID=28108 RepID=A0A6T9XZL0_ALTMA|nr:amidohydrolase family protein [Alteromonas macleodii]CAB9492703.1 putative TIM-barrel fold metal-dependent hydrolase [Alteromonas macleodii]